MPTMNPQTVLESWTFIREQYRFYYGSGHLLRVMVLSTGLLNLRYNQLWVPHRFDFSTIALRHSMREWL